MAAVWKKAKQGGAEHLFLGKILVGLINHDATRPVSEPEKCRASILLPGVQMGSLYHLNEGTAKAAVEKAVKEWLKLVKES